MEMITTKIIPIVIKLACDVDNLVQQLFEPLAIGVVHYFASGIQYNSIYTPIIIDILMVNKIYFLFFCIVWYTNSINTLTAYIFCDSQSSVYI